MAHKDQSGGYSVVRSSRSYGTPEQALQLRVLWSREKNRSQLQLKNLTGGPFVSETGTPDSSESMEVWGWFVASALWLALVTAARFDFAVGVETSKYIPRRLALAWR